MTDVKPPGYFRPPEHGITAPAIAGNSSFGSSLSMYLSSNNRSQDRRLYKQGILAFTGRLFRFPQQHGSAPLGKLGSRVLEGREVDCNAGH